MTEKSAKPQLRFAGFDDTWEQRKLSDIADKVTEKEWWTTNIYEIYYQLSGVWNNQPTRLFRPRHRKDSEVWMDTI